jgi:parallel beta-helix repeat protein
MLIGSTVYWNTTGAGGDGGNASSGDGGNGGNGGDGASIFTNGGTTVLVESILSNNETGLGGSAGSGSGSPYDGYRGDGGGLASENSSATLSDTTVRDNRGLLGGGIYGSSTVVTLDSCTVSGNIADDSGGGICNSGGSTLALTNSTVSSNRAYKHGGGIRNSSGTATLTHVTVVYNTADLDDDGSGDGGGFMNSGTLTLNNTIVAENTDKGDENPDCRGTAISGDYNLLGQDSADCTFTPQPHDQVGTIMSPINPGVALNLEDNGGPTLTHAIKSNSPAANQIPTGVNGCVPGARDQRGVLRLPPCDIGAYEVDPESVYLPLVVKD